MILLMINPVYGEDFYNYINSNKNFKEFVHKNFHLYECSNSNKIRNFCTHFKFLFENEVSEKCSYAIGFVGIAHMICFQDISLFNLEMKLRYFIIYNQPYFGMVGENN